MGNIDISDVGNLIHDFNGSIVLGFRVVVNFMVNLCVVFLEHISIFRIDHEQNTKETKPNFVDEVLFIVETVDIPNFSVDTSKVHYEKGILVFNKIVETVKNAELRI